MTARLTRDALAGALLILFGVGMMVWAYQTLPMGSPRRMGPGMYPTGIGVLITLSGLAILVPALWKRGGALDFRPNWRAVAGISGALTAFALLVAPFGLAPAIVALVVIGALAERSQIWVGTLTVAAILPVVVYVIFKLGLGLPMAMASWPF